MSKLTHSKNLLLMFLFCGLALPVTAQASFYANCILTVSVQKMHKTTKQQSKGQQLKLTLEVLAIGKQSGHSKTYCSDRKMQGKRFTTGVDFGKHKKLALQAKKGMKLRVRFHYSNGRGQHGIIHRRYWGVKGLATKRTPAKRKKPTTRK